MINKVLLIALAAVLTCVVTYRPEWLSANTFLDEFINHEILALFAVVLTVTLASVANIHLAINRMIAQSFRNDETARRMANGIKGEIRDNSRIIFISFFAALFALIIKDLIPDETLHIAIANGFLIWVLVLNLLTIMDVYNVVYGLSDIQSVLPAPPPRPDPVDYTEEAPIVGADTVEPEQKAKDAEPETSS